MIKESLFNLDFAELPIWQEQSYRRKQLATWLYDKGLSNFEQMSDAPKAWRSELEANHRISPFQGYERFASEDGSVRYLFKLDDGKQTEAVYMPYHNRKTLCISSMVGCPAACAFCATGAYGFGRNLSSAEIIGQIVMVALAEGFSPREIRNVVLMGMGEALLNYNHAIAAIKRMIDAEMLDMSPRRITLSTVGLPKQIMRLAHEELPLVLALSLHAPDEETRRQIIPSAHAHSIPDIMAALCYWQEKIGRRITIEYTMLAGVNDHLWQADALIKLLKDLQVHINLIPFNAWAGAGFCSSSPPT
ncbi:MAG: 23S rRNA (adenine(2503)-C(2))-methyltransferase RlmN [Deinococcales bacterium]